MVRMLLCVVILGLTALCESNLHGAVALKQDFDGFITGQLGTVGQGNVATVGGHWVADGDGGDPTIIAQNAGQPANLSVRLTQGENSLIGSSSVAPIAQDTEFVVSFSVFFRDIGDGEQIGSFYAYVDNSSSLSTSSRGIALYTNTVGDLLVYDASVTAYRGVKAGANFYSSKDSWVSFKILVTTWNDGSGYGRYDTYVNTGSGWLEVDSDNAFNSADLHSGVNAALFRPRSPTNEVLVYIDNVSIASTPVDCQDAILLGYALNSDLNLDCHVDFTDLKEALTSYLTGNDPAISEPNGTVIQTSFENFPAGSILGGVGNWETVEGRWRDLGPFYPDPSIITSQTHTGLQCYQISRGPNAGTTSTGWTTIAAVPVDATQVELVLWAKKVAGGGLVAWMNNYDYYNNQSVSIYIRPDNGNLYALAMRDDGNLGWDQTTANIAVDTWTGIKIVITNFGDGTSTVAGRGFYDVYVNTGSTWVLALSNVRFNSSQLDRRINSITFDPQGTSDAVVCYIDDVALTWVNANSTKPSVPVDNSVTVLDQNFDSFPLGSISVIGRNTGDRTTIGGEWRDMGDFYTDPNIVNTVSHSGNQSYRISRMPTGGSSVGWTTAQAVPEGVSFEISYWTYIVPGDGSYVLWPNNYDNGQGQLHQSVSVFIYNKQLEVLAMDNNGNVGWLNTGTVVDVNTWVGIKVIVKSWGDGSDTVAGRGFYDIYTNKGMGWTLAYANIGLKSSELNSGVNSVFISPVAPDGSLSGYIDDFKLVSTPLNCAELFILGKELVGDMNRDCNVDLKDFAEFAQEWLKCNVPNDPACIANW